MMISNFFKTYQPRRAHSSVKSLATGLTIVEVVLAASIVSLLFASVSMYFERALIVNRRTTQYIQSAFLLEETVEVVKGIRDAGWAANIAPMTLGTTYYLYWNGALWVATTTEYQVENYYNRSFTLSSVNRDASDNIAPSGTNDAGTRKITATVSWHQRSGTTTRQVEAYIANLFE
ncbi:MAG: hypothetical protein A3D65_01220 [Candidatus Lloydbacteria bacterium RIFCSPHIGHO2_02_FULL_50_13]|uniref:Type II secretion system protein GspI C-terminal domain-containing protein n=1 Tax=Candidatus Lloydbacteria bacterium RIFCSPHIGHO2_02_FULL_50_13 TaxID=1798661 RepID=A0A1G2D5E9_9BACT|nr:MAG: hypothetical protein A3D65_01220 [Candidatus Lloydbacteria bacterium RIFCSPHIGHO2_02_FULL_50_13]